VKLFVNQAVPPCRVRSWRASATVSRRNLEFDMKTRWNSLVVGGCNVVGLTLFALSVTAGGSAVRAAGDSAVLNSVALEPLMKLADVFQQRIAKIEASVAAVTQSLTTKRVAAQELCVADESGAQTCITKAQLDALLKSALQTAQAAPAPATPASAPEAAPAPASPAEQAACPEKCVAPDAIAAAAASETPPAVEAPAPEGPAATPSTTQPVAEHHQAAAETAVAAKTFIATAAKPAPVPAETPAKQEEPAQTPPATTGSAAQEPKAVPAEAPALSEH
jgi:hypothetical protein